MDLLLWFGITKRVSEGREGSVREKKLYLGWMRTDLESGKQ